jgi:hypothetical protein
VAQEVVAEAGEAVAGGSHRGRDANCAIWTDQVSMGLLVICAEERDICVDF